MSDVIPSRAKPVVTIALIALTVGSFLYGLQLSAFERRALFVRFGVVPAEFAWPTLFTSLLFHTGWLHVSANALSLWLFGSNVEDVFGRVRTGAFGDVRHDVLHSAGTAALKRGAVDWMPAPEERSKMAATRRLVPGRTLRVR